MRQVGTTHFSVAFDNGGVDTVEGLLLWERDVEHAEEWDEARIHFIPAASCFPHGCNEAQVFEEFIVELLLSVVHASSVQQQLQQRNRLLCAIVVHLEGNLERN